MGIKVNNIEEQMVLFFVTKEGHKKYNSSKI